VRLSKLLKNGVISFEDLVLTAIKMTFPGAPAVLEEYQVAMTYFDIDNDCVTIASTDELIDAIEQFSDSQAVLRITTDVKRSNNRASAPPVSPSRAACPPSDCKPPAKNSPKSPPGSSGSRPPHIHNVVESIVSVLATAVIALQNHVKEATQPSSATNSSATNSAADAGYAQHPAATTAADPAPFVPLTPDTFVVDECKSVQADEGEGLAKEVVDTIAMTEAPTSDETKTEVRPFIHGRHTCDSCLTTPIVGIRYHSTNLPDYDLCSKCIGTYKGNEFKFEPVELDRDVQFQERWHRKRAAKLAFCGPRGPYECPPSQYERINRCFPQGHQGATVHGRRRGPQFRCARNFGPQQAMGMDAALKEAIRRSLQDAQKEQEKFDVQSATKEPSVTIEEPNTEMLESIIDAVVVSSAPLAKEASITTAEPIDERTEAVTMDPLEDSKPAAIVPNTNDSSFASDAAGSGEAAEALGFTLDQCADAIDAMMSEVERDMLHRTMNDEASVDSEDNVVVEPEIIVTADVEVLRGDDDHTILLGEYPKDEDDINSQASDDWHVVTEDSQIANDEIIARAAQFLGSALFESEMGRDAGSIVDLNNSNISTASSALTFTPTLASEVVTAQFDRWAFQLQQLRELGFYDDAATIEILERFTAANIGSNSDDEVSVTRVVNELLKGQN